MRVAVPLSLRGLGLGPLFVAASRHGELRLGVALEPNGLKQMLRRLGRQTGIPKIRAHRFRHTFATWAIQQDAREFDVQYLLGHSSPDMVRRYTATYNSSRPLEDMLRSRRRRCWKRRFHQSRTGPTPKFLNLRPDQLRLSADARNPALKPGSSQLAGHSNAF